MFKRKAAFIFVLLVLASYWPVFKGRVPFPKDVVLNFPEWEGWRAGKLVYESHAEMGDETTLFYPFRHFMREAASNGELPLWNPHILSGTPFLGEPQSALFYPLNIFYYFLPTPWAWTARLLLTLILAGFMAAVFAKSLGCSESGSIVTGMVFAFSAFMTVYQGFMITDSALWLPLALWSVNRMQRVPGFSSVALGAVAFSLPVLAGHPETAAFVTCIAIAFVLYRCIFPPKTSDSAVSNRIGLLLIFAGAGVLALLLAAVQIFPTLEWLGQITHGLHMRWPARPVQEMLTFFSRDIVHSPGVGNIDVPVGAAYAGMLTLVAASLAALHRNRRDAGFFAGLLAAALMVVYGGEPLFWISQHTPVISGLKSSFLLLAVDFSLAVLAGFGFSALGELIQHSFRGRRLLWFALPGIVLICGGVAIWILQGFTHRWLWSRSPFSSAVLLAISIALVCCRMLGRISRRKFEAIAVVLLGIDLLSFSYHYSPFSRPREIFPDAPVFQFLRAHAGSEYRIAPLNESFASNFEMMYDLFSPAGYDLKLRRADDFFRGLSLNPDTGVSLIAEGVASSRDRRIDMMNIKYLVSCFKATEILKSMPDRFTPVFSDGAVSVFENRSVLPRSFLVPQSGVEVIPEEIGQLSRIQEAGFDPEKNVILPGKADFGGGTERATNPRAGKVVLLHHGFNEVHVRASVAEPSVLVLSQVFYPGWKVRVNGEEKPLLRPNYALTGVTLEKGSYDVQFVYRPQSFIVGLWVSAAGILILVCLFILERRYGFKRPAQIARL